MQKLDLEKIYSELKKEYLSNGLDSKGVKLPKLKDSNGYTKNALVLIFLYQNLSKPVKLLRITLLVQE